jgi:hypothetical protein
MHTQLGCVARVHQKASDTDESLEAGAERTRGKQAHAYRSVKLDTWQLFMAGMHGGRVDTVCTDFFFSPLVRCDCDATLLKPTQGRC